MSNQAEPSAGAASAPEAESAFRAESALEGDPAGAEPAASAMGAAATVTEGQPVEVRRSPRYFRLMALGAGLGAVAAFISAFSVRPSDGYSQAQVFGFLLLFGVVAGGILGAIAGLILDKLVGRKTVSLTANKLAVNEPVGRNEWEPDDERAGDQQVSDVASNSSTHDSFAPAQPGSQQ